jgi:cellulose synthase operon protein B
VREERDLRARVNVRDSGLRRLKSLTGLLVVATAALAGTFTGIAAGTTAGRKLIRVQPRAAAAVPKPGGSHRRSERVPPPPPLPPLGSQATPAPAPAPVPPPAAAPPTAAPVVVSGGS